jgi:hypothetical protein
MKLQMMKEEYIEIGYLAYLKPFLVKKRNYLKKMQIIA